ncbi:MAG TPA: 4-hydroxy-tetrahydrodipicolinate reductase, partial [Candidatus Cloacimonas sp.]|nr:4-hydroxy-tetrahydrodipicolinate reductase [Candidatus Cloacimonas sp.]
MTTICLIGYGKMGRMLHQLAPEKGLKVVGMVDPVWDGAAREISRDSLNNADVAIEFSHPSAVLSNLERLLDLNQNCVIGTTGWHQDLPRIVEMAKSSGIGMVYGANFSLGMNLFSRLIVDAVKLFDGFDDYDLMAWEKHHAQKADSPSGTAVELAKLILENSSRKTK